MDENFFPLSLTRSIGELRCGATTLAEHPARKIKYIWELIKYLKEDLEADVASRGPRVAGRISPAAVLLGRENMLIEEGAEVEAGAVLDARSGPIYIGKNTIVRPHSYLRGPLSIGPECRIGGEVIHSIFHGYSNKAHYGFIGHSYIGEWVNLGAGTTNSNLKNTYGTVKVTLNGKEIDTHETFMGCFIGDHAKAGIGTLITTGAVIGVMANVLGGRVAPKVVPSFTWADGKPYQLEKALKTMEIVMGRRGVKVDPAYKELFKKISRFTI